MRRRKMTVMVMVMKMMVISMVMAVMKIMINVAEIYSERNHSYDSTKISMK